MKSILVIEFDDEWLDRTNITYDEMIADVTIYKKECLENQCDYSQRLYRCWCPLKPLLKKVNVYFKEDEVERVFKKYYWEKDKFGIHNFKKSIEYAFICGYKMCIESILGEEE